VASPERGVKPRFLAWQLRLWALSGSVFPVWGDCG
jgi:hypothetical protein